MLTPGSVLQGRYRVIRQIGGGGQAVVYLAEDLNWNAQRAVKQLTPDPTVTSQERQDAYKQFRREAEVLAELTHSNIVRVWDHFHEGGHAYLVMDYVDGRTLQEILDQTSGFLPEAAVRRWADQLCDVLEYLHHRQPPIIFRDLNPSNVMLDQNDRIKLIDFGIVRHFQAGQTKDTMFMGTPGYAPLEQHGHGQTDERSDIYALGATLYHLLTKHEPEPAPARVVPGQPDPLQPPRKYNSNITSDTEDALLTAMAVAPDKRFQSVSEMKQALVGTLEAGAGVPWLALAGLVLLIAAASLVWQRGFGLSSSQPPPTPVGGGLPSATVVRTSATSEPSIGVATTTSSPSPVGGTADTDTPTTTSLPPTETSTTGAAPTGVVEPTDTPVPPTATRISTQIPTPTATATVPPTHTWTFTPLPTDTPTRTRTPTAIPTRTFTPPPSATATWTQVPTAMPTATESVPTPEHTTFKLAIGQYRLAEKEALRTLDPAKVDELTTYAYGEALAAVTQHIEELRAQGHYQELVVRQLDVQHVTLRDGGESAGVLVQEQHTLRTYQSSNDGDRLVEEEQFDGQIVYGLIYLDSRWKVERIRPLENASP